MSEDASPVSAAAGLPPAAAGAGLLTPARLIMAVFFLHAVGLSNLWPRIPDLQAKLGVGPGELSIAMLGLPVATVLGSPLRREPGRAVRPPEHPDSGPSADHAQHRPAGLVVRRRDPVHSAVPDRPVLPGRRHCDERRGRPHRALGRAADHEHLPRMLECRRRDRRPDRHRLPQGRHPHRLASPDRRARPPAAGAFNSRARSPRSPRAPRPAGLRSRCRRAASSASASSCSAR